MTVTAHDYLRVSTSKQRSNARQHTDNVAAATAQGWAFGRTYEDTGSASQYGTKTRADFERLVADLRAGAIPPGDVLILWESSRGSREQVEWATLLNLLRDKGVLVHVTTHHRTYNLSNARDRRSLDEDGVDSAYESAKTSGRVRIAAVENAQNGRPYGPVPFGYMRVYDTATGRLIGQEKDPKRAPIVAELFARLEAGHSLRSIAADFAERGITRAPREGRPEGPISAPQLRNMALQAGYAGLRVSGTTDMSVEAVWPEIVTPRQYHAVKRILTDPTRKVSRPGRGKWFLSMIAKCGACDSPLSVRYKGGGPRYRCHQKSHVLIDMTELDEIAETAILGYLNRDDVLEALSAAWSDEDERLRQIRDDLDTARGELRELGAGVGAGKITMDLAAMAEPGIRRRIRDLEAQEREAALPAVLRGLVGVGLTRAQWRAKPMSTRREVARMLLSVEHLGQLRVGRLTGQRIVFWKPDNVARPVRAQDAVAAAEMPVENTEAAQVSDGPAAWSRELQEHVTRYGQALAAHGASVPEGEELGTLASLLKPVTEP